MIQHYGLDREKEIALINKQKKWFILQADMYCKRAKRLYLKTKFEPSREAKDEYIKAQAIYDFLRSVLNFKFSHKYSPPPK